MHFWVKTFGQLFLQRESRGLKSMGVSKTWPTIVANQDPRELASDGPKPVCLVNVSCRSIQIVDLLYLVVVMGNMWSENWNMTETTTDNLVFDSILVGCKIWKNGFDWDVISLLRDDSIDSSIKVIFFAVPMYHDMWKMSWYNSINIRHKWWD